jgi:hypothetical protein
MSIPERHEQFLRQSCRATHAGGLHCPTANRTALFSGVAGSMTSMRRTTGGFAKDTSTPPERRERDERGSATERTPPDEHRSFYGYTAGGSTYSPPDTTSPSEHWERLVAEATRCSGPLLKPPDPADWGSTESLNQGQCAGAHASCEDVCLDERTVSDLEQIDPSEETSVQVRNADDGRKQEELVRTAWGILRRNTDILRWAICKAYDKRVELSWSNRMERRLRNCYQDMMNEMWPDAVFGRTGASRVNIKFHDLSSRITGAPAWGIRLGRSGGKWRKYQYIWLSGPRKTDRFFAALDLACTLFHELFHVMGCGAHREDEHGELAPCDEIYLAENIARYGLYKRYPDVAASICRATPRGDTDSLFWYDKGVWPDRDCLTHGVGGPGWITDQLLDLVDEEPDQEPSVGSPGWLEATLRKNATRIEGPLRT